MHKYVHLALVTTLSAFGLHAQAVLGLQQIETTGMVGIASGQTAQLNLLNPGIQAPALGVMCPATVSFWDSAGKQLKSATLTVIPGQSQSFAIKSDTDLNLATGARTEIRAVIAQPPISPSATTGPAAAAVCKVVPTLEIVDTASGRTLVILGHTTTIPSILASPQRN